MNQKSFVVGIIAQLMSEGLEGPALTSRASEKVLEGILAGECPVGKAMDEKGAAAYAKQVVNNYLKKDPSLNGGVKYTPATKRGPIVKDPFLKKLKESLKSAQANNLDMSIIQGVEAKIAEVEAKLKSEKAKTGTMPVEETLEFLAELGLVPSEESA